MRPVPILLTCDIHTHTYGEARVREDLLQAREILQGAGLRCTFFFPAQSANLLKDQVAALRKEGHEIGCHGLTHEPWEQYDLLPSDEQWRLLQEATARLSDILGGSPASFRGPAFKVSGATLKILQNLGYQADLSVNAQRLGIFGSDIFNVRPLFAPRKPFHPSAENPFRAGDLRLWEIPVSAFGLPFLSNTERLLGLPFMRFFFRFLHGETRVTGKPIVFVFHAEDLNRRRGTEIRRARLSWKHFAPSKTYGFMFREFLFESDWAKVTDDLTRLFRLMSLAKGSEFLTVTEYLGRLAPRGRVEPSPADAKQAFN